ncbi:hypothetical protein KC963_00600 [Candidatus Saccharibacteria bacterium]|nr:hypothetical protein [Candidatus Saccharibacteria bacterium]
MSTFLSGRDEFEKEWLHWSPPRNEYGMYVSDVVEAKFSMWSALQIRINYYKQLIEELENALSKAQSLGT